MKPELILPGGDLERVKIAFTYGADAVYVGLNKHSLRKAEIRFDIPEIKEAIEYAHSLKKRLFVTFNIFAHNEQLADIEKDMKEIAKYNPDAFIVADLGVINIAKKVAPNVPIHVSTQANTVNIEDVKFWRDFGAKRVVLARELTLEEIKQIHDAVPDIELEAFVHGSMCISYSGRCLLSSYMTGRNANQGDCAQPCRWNYKLYSSSEQSESRSSSRLRSNNKFYLEEKMRPGEYFPIEETENGTNIMSSRDLALVEYLPEVLNTGVTGLKVEGRNKSEYYLATIGYTYRKAINLISEGKYDKKAKAELRGELDKINNREYTTGFIFGDAKAGETYEGRSPIRNWDYVASVISTEAEKSAHGRSLDVARDDKNLHKINTSSPVILRSEGDASRREDLGEIATSPVPRNDEGVVHEIIVKNKISVDDKVEIVTPQELFQDKIIAITDLEGREIPEINPGKADQKAIIKLRNSYPVNSFIRKQL